MTAAERNHRRLVMFVKDDVILFCLLFLGWLLHACRRAWENDWTAEKNGAEG